MAPGCLVSGEEEKIRRERSLSLILHTHNERFEKKRPPQKKKKPQGNITPITDQKTDSK